MDTDTDAAHVRRRRRRLLGLLVLFVALLIVGTSLIFAGRPGIGITLVAVSPLALVLAGVLLYRG